MCNCLNVYLYICSLQLKPFQLVGLNWLKIMHTQDLNGILADEMVNILLIFINPYFAESMYKVRVNSENYFSAKKVCFAHCSDWSIKWQLATPFFALQ